MEIVLTDNIIYTTKIIEMDDGLGIIVSPELMAEMNLSEGDRFDAKAENGCITLTLIKDTES